MPQEFDNQHLPEDDGASETRVAKLEADVVEIRERLTRIETRLDQTATKADLQQAVATMIKWLVGTLLGSCALMIAIMTFVLNLAPSQARFAKPEPPAIIINIPPGALQWQPAPEGAQPSPRKP